MRIKCILCDKEGVLKGIRPDYNKYDSADTSGKSYGLRKVYEYYECKDCGLWWTKNVDDDYDRLYQTEDYWFDHHKRMGWNVLTDQVRIDNDIKYSKLRMEYFERCGIIWENKRLLEVGSSTGTLLKELRTKSNDVVGVEPNSTVAAIAEAFSGVPVKTTIDDIEDNTCAFVAAIDVLEHIADPLIECKKWVGKLHKDGILYLELPDAGCEHAINNGVNWDYVMHEHVFYYGKNQVTKLFQKFNCTLLWADNWLTTDRQRLVFRK